MTPATVATAPIDEEVDTAAETAVEAPTEEVSDTAPDAETAEAAESTESTENADKPKRGRPKSTAKKTRTVELVLTVTGTLDGSWQADLVHGTKRVVSGLTIPAAAVSRAAQELHPEVAKAIDSVISDAREQHETRLRELEAEVAKVKQALADLGDAPSE